MSTVSLQYWGKETFIDFKIKEQRVIEFFFYLFEKIGRDLYQLKPMCVIRLKNPLVRTGIIAEFQD